MTAKAGGMAFDKQNGTVDAYDVAISVTENIELVGVVRVLGTPENPEKILICDWWLDEENRRKGYGTQALRVLNKHCPALYVTHVEAQAEPFWTKMIGRGLVIRKVKDEDIRLSLIGTAFEVMQGS